MAGTPVGIVMLCCPVDQSWSHNKPRSHLGRSTKGVGATVVGLAQPAPSLQMSPPPSGFGERSGGGSGGSLSHFYSGSPTSYFTSGLQAGLKQSHLKVRSSHRPRMGAQGEPLRPCVPRPSLGCWQGSALLRAELKHHPLHTGVSHLVLTTQPSHLFSPPPSNPGCGWY